MSLCYFKSISLTIKMIKVFLVRVIGSSMVSKVDEDDYDVDDDEDEEPLFACAGLKAVCVSACAAVRLSWRTFYSTTRLREGTRIRDRITNTQTVLSRGTFNHRRAAQNI